MKLQFVRWVFSTGNEKDWSPDIFHFLIDLSHGSRSTRRNRNVLNWSWKSWGRAVPPGCRWRHRNPSVHSRSSRCRWGLTTKTIKYYIYIPYIHIKQWHCCRFISSSRRRRSCRKTLLSSWRRGSSWRNAALPTSTRRSSWDHDWRRLNGR